MVYRMIPVVLVVLAAGCEPENNGPPSAQSASGSSYDSWTDNHGFGYEYDFESLYGVRYRSDAEEGGITGEDIDLAIESAAACLGVAIRDSYDLYVITIPEITTSSEDAEGTFYFTGPPLVLVEPLLPPETRESYMPMLEHEMVHFLLLAEYGDADPTHLSACYPHGTILAVTQ